MGLIIALKNVIDGRLARRRQAAADAAQAAPAAP
jgi:hypothetical protein